MKKTFSVVEVLKSAWQLFLIHKKFYIKTVLIYGLIAVAADLLSDDKSMRLVDVILGLVSTASSWYGTFILIKASLSLTQNKPIPSDVSSLSLMSAVYLVLASILVACGVFLGLILFIVPGLIFAVRSSLAQYIIIDQNEKVIPAIKKSMALTKGYFWSFARLILCICVLGLLSMFPLFGLGFIVLIPVSTIAMSLVYRKISVIEPMVEVIPQV